MNIKQYQKLKTYSRSMRSVGVNGNVGLVFFVKVFGVFGAHQKILRICDNFIYDGDGSGGVEEFDRNQDFSMFYLKIYKILWLRATEFYGDWGGVLVVDKFNFGSMGIDVFVVCGGWWGGIGRNWDFSIFWWLGVSAVFFGFRLSDMMDARVVRYCS